jgi:hypothetical protein
MKAIRYFFSAILTIVLLLSACTDTNDGVYVAPISISEKIQGSWAAISVKQIDEIAKTNGQTPTDLSLTTKFNFSTFAIHLNVDEKNNPTTFQISGTSPALMSTSGYWDLAHLFPNTDTTPSQIILYSDAAKTQKTATLDITGMPGSVKILEFRFTRKANGVAFVSYIYRLVPN